MLKLKGKNRPEIMSTLITKNEVNSQSSLTSRAAHLGPEKNSDLALPHSSRLRHYNWSWEAISKQESTV